MDDVRAAAVATGRAVLWNAKQTSNLASLALPEARLIGPVKISDMK
jgi:hypothetical protein